MHGCGDDVAVVMWRSTQGEGCEVLSCQYTHILAGCFKIK